MGEFEERWMYKKAEFSRGDPRDRQQDSATRQPPRRETLEGTRCENAQQGLRQKLPGNALATSRTHKQARKRIS
jgi:hypothetical protein